MRPNNFNAVSAGMSRLREKGGASSESLYEATNCFVNASRMPQRRPGTLSAHTFTGAAVGKTHGLATFNGNMYTFTANASAAALSSSSWRIIMLRHPTPGYAGDIAKIHFAKAYMAHMYVVAEFTADGSIPAATYHYWLQEPPTWMANTIYTANTLVQPTVQTGLYERAIQATTAAPSWTAGLQHSLGDIIQPTEYNGFAYYALEINGALISPSPPTASSGQVEPTWPTVNGTTILETSSGAANIVPTPPPTPPDATPPGRDSGGKYTNMGGSGNRFNIPIRVP